MDLDSLDGDEDIEMRSPGDIQKHWFKNLLLASESSGNTRKTAKDELYSHVSTLFDKAEASGSKEDAAAAETALGDLVLKLVELMPKAQQHWQRRIWNHYCDLWKLLCTNPHMQPLLLRHKWSVLGALLKMYIGVLPKWNSPQQQQQ